jgi:hypothetical protein
MNGDTTDLVLSLSVPSSIVLLALVYYYCYICDCIKIAPKHPVQQTDLPITASPHVNIICDNPSIRFQVVYVQPQT